MIPEFRPILYGSKFAPVAERFFQALCDHPYGLTAQEAAAIIYGAKGGPEGVKAVLCTTAHGINKRARKAGLGIRVRGHGGPGSKWQVWIIGGQQVKWESMWHRPFDYPERLGDST
jgi:hypothetical protein